MLWADGLHPFAFVTCSAEPGQRASDRPPSPLALARRVRERILGPGTLETLIVTPSRRGADDPGMAADGRVPDVPADSSTAGPAFSGPIPPAHPSLPLFSLRPAFLAAVRPGYAVPSWMRRWRQRTGRCAEHIDTLLRPGGVLAAALAAVKPPSDRARTGTRGRPRAHPWRGSIPVPRTSRLGLAARVPGGRPANDAIAQYNRSSRP